MSMKSMVAECLANRPKVKRLFLLVWRTFSPLFKLINLMVVPRYFWFLNEWRKYRALGGEAKFANWYPCLLDKTSSTAFDPQYFHQAVWGMKKIMQQSPKSHVDVGSEIAFVGMLSTVTDVTFVDIRPVEIELERFTCKDASILALPFEKDSIKSLSCMHVIEHIGLGRYGDPLDPDGSVKACNELQRVLAPGGKLYVTVPVHQASGRSVDVYFNGLRNFSIHEISAYFSELKLQSLSVVDGDGELLDDVDPREVTLTMGRFSDYALGMFVFEK